MYITMFACAVGLWMMVQRFGLSVEDLLSYTFITIGFLVVIIGIAALMGWLLRKTLGKK